MIFLTGSTGYIGSYLAAGLLEKTTESLALLVRASDQEEAKRRLWKSLQLHMDFTTFWGFLTSRISIFCGDLTKQFFGLKEARYKELVLATNSVIHCAASLNRRSAKSCFNVNLRGTLEVIELAQRADRDHGVRRFSDISTVAVSGKRQDDLVAETSMIEWDRSDYDPYARTKKFTEHMIHRLLPNVETTVFRPSTVLGDSTKQGTTQFDMVRAFVWLAYMPILPLASHWRMDIVPVNYVADAVIAVHQAAKDPHGSYNLSSGEKSLTYGEILRSLRESGFKFPHIFAPRLSRPFKRALDQLMKTPRRWKIAPGAAMMRVFMPYLAYNTVFDNQNIVEKLDREPTPFSDYAYGLLQFAQKNHFRYPYKPWPKMVD